MPRALSKPIEWLAVKLGLSEALRSDTKVFRQKCSQWRYAQTNDAEVWKDDPDLDATKNAQKLLESDPDAAITQLQVLATSGSLWSMMLLGWAYYTGTGVSANRALAEHWLKLASDGGCQQAQLRLGRILSKCGEFNECEQIYALGITLNWSPAMYYLAHIKLRQTRTLKRLQEVRVLLEQAEAYGDIEAQVDLGNLMARGWYGLDQIPKGFLHLFKGARKAVAFVDTNATDVGSNSII